MNKSNLYIKGHCVIYALKASVSGYDIYCNDIYFKGYRTLKLGEQCM